MSARPARAAAVAAGCAAALVVGVRVLRQIRPGVLADPDTAWAAPRLVLTLLVVAGGAVAGVLAAVAILAWAKTPAARGPLRPLALPRSALVLAAAAAIAAGAGLRLSALSRVPEPLWIDDLTLVAPARALQAGPEDFRDAIRPVPFGVPRPYGSIGVLYLEGLRASLTAFGETVPGIRFPSALAGIVSLGTAALLGRALLPSGGGALAALALAGMRWHLILSRWSWNMIVLAPIVDVATLLALSARRKRSAARAAVAGVVAGLGAHVYLAAWPAAAALVLFCAWPGEKAEAASARVSRSAALLAGFLVCASPLFAFREGRVSPYFARVADHNALLEIRRTRSVLPPIAAASDTLAAPWFLPDPGPRHDLPGRSRLGWILGIPVAIALGRALLLPRGELSGLLLAHFAAVLATVVAGGEADHPNGSRFGYLSTVAAVAASAGGVWLSGLPRAPERRRAAALAVCGAFAVQGARGAVDALQRWPSHPATFRAFHGEDTRIGRAAARWEAFGEVEVAPGLGHSDLTIGAVRRYRLDPDLEPDDGPAKKPGIRSRVVPAGTPASEGERVVQRIADPAGTERARVLASRGPDGPISEPGRSGSARRR